MEYLVSGGILTLGYLFSKNSGDKSINYEPAKVYENQKPNGDNIYDSMKSREIENLMQDKADKIFKEAQDKNTTYLVAGPPQKMFMNKLDNDSKIPIEFNSFNKLYDIKLENIRKDVEVQNTSTGLSDSGGWNNNIIQPKTFTSLTGETINEKD